MNIRTISLVSISILALVFSPHESNAQDFSVSVNPANSQFQPVQIDNSWHTVNSGTIFNASYILPKNSESESVRTNLTDSTYYTSVITKEYSFVGFRVGTSSTNYTASSLQNYLETTTNTSVSISAVCKETEKSIRTNYKYDKVIGTPVEEKTTDRDIVSNRIDLNFYKIPAFSTTLDEAVETIWSTTSPKVFKCSAEGGNSWSYDFYFTVNGNGRVNAANHSLSVPLTCTSESSKIDVVVENVKCFAPDGLTDWTPAAAKGSIHHAYTVWALPSVTREASIDPETYIFGGRTLTLSPVFAGGDSNAWTYKWEVANGIRNSSTISLSTEDGSLLLNASERTHNIIKLTASNKPSGLADTTLVLTYNIYTLPEPKVTFDDHDFTGFDGEKFAINLHISDIANNAYYPIETGQQTLPVCYYIQNGSKHYLSATGTSNYSGTYSYTGYITPTESNGIEPIQIIWSRQLRHSSDNFNEDCQSYTFNKSIDLKICRKPSIEDISLDGSDEYAIARVGHVLKLQAQANTLPLSGSWSYRWSMSNATSSSLDYSVSASDIQAISGNDTYKKTYSLEATYTLNNEIKSKETISIPFSITYCAIPNGAQTQKDVTTCVGRTTQLGLTYSGGFQDGWSTVWYDEQGNVLPDFDSNGGSVSFNSDIDAEYEIKKYKAELRNEYRGKQWYSTPLEYTVTLYHRPEVTVDKLGPNVTEGVVNIYGGDNDEINVSQLGGFPGGWHYSWEKNGNIVDSNSEISITSKEKGNGESKSTDVYTVRVYNYANNNPQDLWFDKRYVINYNIWSKGKLDLNSRQAKTDIYGDGTPCNGKVWNETAISMGTLGGYNEGWTFKWEVLSNPYAVIALIPADGGATIGKTNIYAKNVSGQVRTVKLLLTAQNAIGNNKGNSDSAIFYMNVYPKAEVVWDFEDNQETNMYYGGSQNISVASSGGNLSSWHLNWYSEGNNYSESYVTGGDGHFSTSFRSATKEAPSSEKDFLQKDLVIADNYSPNGEELWFSKRITHLVHWWSKGSFKETNEHDQYCLGGDDDDDPSGRYAIFEDEILGGCHANNSGIQHTSYSWQIFDGSKYIDLPTAQASLRSLGIEEVIDNSTDNKVNISFKGYNVGLSPKDVYLSMKWQNKVDNEHLGNAGSCNYHIIVYPGIITPKKNGTWTEDTETRRDIDNKKISLEAGLGGGTWKYLWYDNGTLIHEGVDSELNLSFVDNSQFKSVKNHNITVEWTNYRPDGSVWKHGVFIQPIKVYNTPITPSKLESKGNGTSNIYIANLDNLGLDDNQLFSSPYDYIIQFGDGSSVTSEGEETSQRWHQYTSYPINPWCRTCWLYDDGFSCYSDMVDTNGNTRAYTSIESIDNDIREEEFIIMRSNGSVFRIVHGGFDYDDLSEGVYIVKNCLTGEARRIMIKR